MVVNNYPILVVFHFYYILPQPPNGTITGAPLNYCSCFHLIFFLVHSPFQIKKTPFEWFTSFPLLHLYSPSLSFLLAFLSSGLPFGFMSPVTEGAVPLSALSAAEAVNMPLLCICVRTWLCVLLYDPCKCSGYSQELGLCDILQLLWGVWAYLLWMGKRERKARQGTVCCVLLWINTINNVCNGVQQGFQFPVFWKDFTVHIYP